MEFGIWPSACITVKKVMLSLCVKLTTSRGVTIYKRNISCMKVEMIHNWQFSPPSPHKAYFCRLFGFNTISLQVGVVLSFGRKTTGTLVYVPFGCSAV